MALFDSKWLAECRCGDWLVVAENDTYAVAYPEPCRRRDQERIVRLLAAAPDLLNELINLTARFKAAIVEAGTDEKFAEHAVASARAAINKATTPMQAKSEDDQTHE